MPISYDPGISYHGDAYLASGLQNLGSGIGQAFGGFLQQQQQAKHEADMLAYENQKNDAIISHLRQAGYVTPEQYAEYQGANAKQKKALAEGIAANAAFDIAQKKANFQPRITPVLGGAPGQVAFQGSPNSASLIPPAPGPLQGGPVPGAPGVTAITGGGLTRPEIIKPEPGKEKLTLTPEEIASGQFTHKIPLRQSNGSFVWVDDPTFAGKKASEKSDSFSNFSRDVTALQSLIDSGHLNDPKQYNAVGEQLVKRLQNLTSRTDRPDSSVTTPNKPSSPVPVQVKTVEEAMALPKGTPFYTPDGQLKIR